MRVTFARLTALRRTLYSYFTTDLSRTKGSAASRVPQFCARPAVAAASLLKSASYLMFESGFSTIREFLLTHSKAIGRTTRGFLSRPSIRRNGRLRFAGSARKTDRSLWKQYFSAEPALSSTARAVPPRLVSESGCQLEPAPIDDLIVAIPRKGDGGIPHWRMRASTLLPRRRCSNWRPTAVFVAAGTLLPGRPAVLRRVSTRLFPEFGTGRPILTAEDRFAGSTDSALSGEGTDENKLVAICRSGASGTRG